MKGESEGKRRGRERGEGGKEEREGKRRGRREGCTHGRIHINSIILYIPITYISLTLLHVYLNHKSA